MLLDEIRAGHVERRALPMPRGAALVRVAEAVLATPAARHGIDACARLAHIARRTFTRRFRGETGISFAAWRARVRLLVAVEQLERGIGVSQVAYAVGYATASAFIAVFRRAMGVTPAAYVQARANRR